MLLTFELSSFRENGLLVSPML